MQALILLIIYVCLLFLYYHLGPFKKVAHQSQLDFAIDADEPDDILDTEETILINKISFIVYVTFGILICIYLGITVAKLSRLICNHVSYNWLVYVLFYFAFIRIPFGLMSRIINKIYELESNLGKTAFAITLITSYLLTIIFYDWLPYFLQWPL